MVQSPESVRPTKLLEARNDLGQRNPEIATSRAYSHSRQNRDKRQIRRPDVGSRRESRYGLFQKVSFATPEEVGVPILILTGLQR